MAHHFLAPKITARIQNTILNVSFNKLTKMKIRGKYKCIDFIVFDFLNQVFELKIGPIIICLITNLKGIVRLEFDKTFT